MFQCNFLSSMCPLSRFPFVMVAAFILSLVLPDRISMAADTPLVNGAPYNTSLPAETIASNLYIEVPAGATRLTVTLTNGSGDLDLYLKYGSRINGKKVQEIDADADFISDGPTASEQITVLPTSSPPLRPGRWHVGILNWNSSTTHFTVTATVETAHDSSSAQGNDPVLSRALLANVTDLEADMYLSRLSPSQEAFVREIGYPTEFMKIFSIDQGRIRVNETWVYPGRGLIENFINGIFVKEKIIDKKGGDVPEGHFRPEDYSFHTTFSQVAEKLGQPSKTEKDTIGGKEFKVYTYDGIIFTFLNGQIVSVAAGK